jgi:hypothetical protein
MFSRRLKSLPADPVFPKTLIELGYFLNEKSQVRSIKKPAEDFIFKLTDNDRYNEVRREALHGELSQFGSIARLASSVTSFRRVFFMTFSCRSQRYSPFPNATGLCRS